MELKYAKRMSHLKASEIREILKVTESPEVISFAGGLPAPELFPIEEISAITRLVLTEDGAEALQYTTTEGYTPLRKWIADRLNTTCGTDFDSDNILLTSGSQQALDLSGKVFLDEGDTVLCESPTYLAAISAFRSYGCRFTEVPTDDYGMIPEALEQILHTSKRVKMIYVIPNFQNPTGRSWSLERRQQLAEISKKYQVVVIEDDPYGELRFEGIPLPSVKSFDKTGYIFYLGTFSKIFCPGYRIGWVAGDKNAISKFVLTKQCTDLQCSTIAQRVISKYLERYNLDEHIEKIRNVYRNRRNVAIQTMESLFPEGVEFSRPQGGLFTWVTLPAHMSARLILERSLKRKVAFVPGSSFFPNGGGENTLRLNFSNMSEDRIVTGITCIAEILHEFISAN